ncbi:MAG: DUF362 domain-containing protein [candidate division WOR-3 bacterium]|nr:DUF362 domain-containing protein [candidate division WOR-3 bacterium]
MSEVRFAKFGETSPVDLIKVLLEDKGFLSDVKKGDFVGIKIHVGERGNITHLRPQIVRTVVDLLKKRRAKPFIFDCNTLYRLGRWNAIDHHQTAYFNGFTFATVGAPFLVGDGIIGRDEITIKTNFNEVKEAYVGRIIEDIDYLFVISHFKFHDLFGYGGAIKNVGMGMASRRGKLYLHSDVKPRVLEEKCKLCGDCVRNCPEKAITLNRCATIDLKKCIGCGMCIVSCKEGAIKFNWDQDRNSAVKAVYYTKAIIDKIPKSSFLNVLMDITPHCDCFPTTMNLTVQNIGFLASKDIVAIDNASHHLVEEAKPLKGVGWKREEIASKNKVKALFDNAADMNDYLKIAEDIGLGTRDYNLIEYKP